MINVLFDHQTFSSQRYGGISRYFANIHHYISQQDTVQSDISIIRSENQYIRDYPALLNNQIGNIILKKPTRSYKWNKVYSKYRLLKNDYDILHPTYYNPYFLKYTKKPFVITVHDMIHEIYPEFFESGDISARYKRLCVENASHIIAISESTKNDLINILGVSEDRISVIYHGYDPQLSSPSKITEAPLAFDYLLYVGDRKGYKNWARFVRAIIPLLKMNASMKLVCTGGGSFQSAERELLNRLHVTDQVQQLSVSDKQLSSLYQNALAFIYPSLYEGFGLPILEAFQNQCPVIASDNICFKEIGRDAVAYFNPNDEESILQVVSSVISSSQCTNDLVKKGLSLLPHYAMEQCLEQTLTVYKNIFSKS